MVEPYQAVVTGPFQVLQGPPRTAADIGDKGTTREIADLQRPVGERRTSRPYARPHDATDLRPVECHHERYFYPKNGNSSTQRSRENRDVGESSHLIGNHLIAFQGFHHAYLSSSACSASATFPVASSSAMRMKPHREHAGRLMGKMDCIYWSLTVWTSKGIWH